MVLSISIFLQHPPLTGGSLSLGCSFPIAVLDADTESNISVFSKAKESPALLWCRLGWGCGHSEAWSVLVLEAENQWLLGKISSVSSWWSFCLGTQTGGKSELKSMLGSYRWALRHAQGTAKWRWWCLQEHSLPPMSSGSSSNLQQIAEVWVLCLWEEELWNVHEALGRAFMEAHFIWCKASE